LNPIEWAIRPLQRYADFSGRASRAEYWWYTLASIIAGLGFEYLDKFFGGPLIGVYGPLSLACTLGLLIPGLAVEIRRLHDIDRSGWWILLNLWAYGFVVAGLSQMPVEGIFKSVFKGANIAALVILLLVMLVGTVIMFVFSVTRGTDGPNRYGPDPYGPDQLEEVFG
jgi:uncharacterized membrane protein YhaH (DUF805 family)